MFCGDGQRAFSLPRVTIPHSDRALIRIVRSQVMAVRRNRGGINSAEWASKRGGGGLLVQTPDAHFQIVLNPHQPRPGGGERGRWMSAECGDRAHTVATSRLR